MKLSAIAVLSLAASAAAFAPKATFGTRQCKRLSTKNNANIYTHIRNVKNSHIFLMFIPTYLD